MKIQVTIRNVYGNETIYPACPNSQLFAKLLKQTTLTRSDLSIIKQLGYEVEVMMQKVAV